MFLIDDILLSPFHGLVWVFEELHKAVEADRADESDALTARLSELYMMLDSGQLTGQEFDAAEKAVLDRLDVVRQRDATAEAEDDEQEEEQDDEQEEEQDDEQEEEQDDEQDDEQDESDGGGRTVGGH